MKFLANHPLLLVFGVTVLGLTGYTGYSIIERQQDAGTSWSNRATVVITEPARIVTIVDKVESIGTAKANESVSLTSKVTETVRKVNFEDGMYVDAGDILVELTNAEETAQLAEAEAAVNESSRQFERLKNLIEQKLASETQLDVEQARMETARARLDGIIARLDDRLIRAPFSGILGFRSVSPGTLLTPTTVVTTLDDISVIKLDFSVPENYLAVLAQGQEINARSSAWPGRIFKGTVKTINSRVDPVTRSVSIRAHLNNDDRLLRPGMLLTVNLVRSRTPALVVPEEAVIPVQDQQYVYQVTEGKAVRTKVETGRRRPGIVEILSGLKEGDEVITQGVIKVRPGSPVTLKSTGGQQG